MKLTPIMNMSAKRAPSEKEINMDLIEKGLKAFIDDVGLLEAVPFVDDNRDFGIRTPYREHLDVAIEIMSNLNICSASLMPLMDKAMIVEEYYVEGENYHMPEFQVSNSVTSIVYDMENDGKLFLAVDGSMLSVSTNPKTGIHSLTITSKVSDDFLINKLFEGRHDQFNRSLFNAGKMIESQARP